MSEPSDVSVRLDEQIRLMASLLSATNWPLKAQERKPHGTHAHARATRKFLQEQMAHPAVQGLQSLLDQDAPIEAMFTLIMHFSWPGLEIASLPRWVPPDWDKHIQDFYEKSRLAAWWEKEKEPWDRALAEAGRVFEKVHFKEFLRPFLGEVAEDFVFTPNIANPTDMEVGIRCGKELICIAPPPLAWGDSPPWPYDEDTMVTHSFRVALTQYTRILLLTYLRAHAGQLVDAQKTELPVSDQFRALHPTWEDQFITLFVAAAVAIYLEDYVSEAEAKAYLVIERRARGMTILPGTVSVLRRYLQELGNKYETLIDFLPIFPKQLRVAKKIVTL